MNREKFTTNVPKPPLVLKLEVGAFAHVSTQGMREIAIPYSYNRDEILPSNLVILNKYHAPTKSYLVQFEQYVHQKIWVNAEELQPTHESFEIKVENEESEDEINIRDNDITF